MGLVVVFDDKLATPYSEIELASGEHVMLALERRGLTIKILARPDVPERVVFECSVGTVADICDAVADMSAKKLTPLRVLTTLATRFSDSASLTAAFKKAAQ